jgi:hypothetical protein
MKWKLVFLLLFIAYLPAYSQDNSIKNRYLNISIDIESAEAITELLSKPKADTIQLRKVAALYGNQLLIKKVKGYSGAGEDVFIQTLKEIIETGTVNGNDEYNWKLVKSSLPEIKKLVAYISSNKENFIREVKAIIEPYTPADLNATAKACFLAGGGSLGFTIGDDPTFNVALQKIGNDLKGLQYLVAHELYHTLQDVGQRTRVYKKEATEVSYPLKASYYLLYNLWAEGIATYVADMSKLKKNAAFSEEQIAHYQKNRERRYQNFQLFEALLYRQFNDTSADYQSSYDIAFSTAFDETGYFVGYEMARQIAKHQGNQAIANLLIGDPIRFTIDYISLYKSQPEDKSFIRFSKSFEDIVSKLKELENKL